MKNEDFEISVDSHILSSVGEINRCGQIRVEIVGLMASLVFTQQPKVIQCIIKSGLPKTIFVSLFYCIHNRVCISYSRGILFYIINVIAFSVILLEGIVVNC